MRCLEFLVVFFTAVLMLVTDIARANVRYKEHNKLYQTLANIKPKHDTAKDIIHPLQKVTQKAKADENGLYKILASVKDNKMKRRNMTSVRNAMIRPTEPPTRGTRPTRPTRPTPPTRPTRATNCPCNQNCQSCGCTCHKKNQLEQNSQVRKLISGSRKMNKTPQNLTEMFRKEFQKSRNETEGSRKRDFMSEVLDSSVYSEKHGPTQWQDFYENNAKWDEYQSPQIHHDRKINFEDPNYKVSLGFTDGGHELMEHANDIAHNHVEAYPGEIVSGENYLSKFVSPIQQDVPCSRSHHDYDDKRRSRIKGDPCSGDFNPSQEDRETTRAVFNTLDGFMTPLNSHQGDRKAEQEGSRRHKYEGQEREEENEDGDERRYHEEREREHGSEAPFRGNERFRVRGDRYPHGRHFHDDERVNEDDYENERRKSAEDRNVRIENREQDVEMKTGKENHFVDKQRFNEDATQEDEGRFEEGENEHDNEEDKMSREEEMISKFSPDEEGTAKDNLLDSNGRAMRFEKSDGAVGNFLQQTIEGNGEKSLEEKANFQLEDGSEKESALVEEQHGGMPENEADEGAARRSESEISNRVKGILSMIENTDTMGSSEERKAIQQIMDVSNRENELLAKSFASNVEKKVIGIGERRSPGNHREKEFVDLSPTGGDNSISQILGTPMNDEKTVQRPEALIETVGKVKSITPKITGIGVHRSLLKSLAEVTSPTKQSTLSMLSSLKNQTKSDMRNLKEHLKLFMLHLNEKGVKNPDVERQSLTHTALSSIINEVQKADQNLLNAKSRMMATKSKITTKI